MLWEYFRTENVVIAFTDARDRKKSNKKEKFDTIIRDITYKLVYN